MKKCSYCGRENGEEAENCQECGTAFNPNPGNIKTVHAQFSKPVIVVLTLLALYLPYSWVLFMNGPRDNPLQWVKMWPELPGFVLYGFSFLFLGMGKWNVPQWLFHVKLLAITGLFIWVMINFAIEYRHRGAMAVFVIMAISCLLGFLAYGMAAA